MRKGVIGACSQLYRGPPEVKSHTAILRNLTVLKCSVVPTLVRTLPHVTIFTNY